MAQDAWQQPRTWHDDQPQLLKKRERVQLEPMLRDPSIDETVELKAGERDLPLSRRKPLKLAGVSALEADTLRDQIAFSHRVLNGETKIRKPLDEPRKEPRPSLGVQRFGLETRWSIGNVTRSTNVSLTSVVALIEDLDPPTRNGLVVLYRGCPTRLTWVPLR
jgi:hypothetical protein